MATPQRSLMMEIEIKFGKGRSDRVKVHYDDDADLLADEFVRRHKLKETSKPVIAQYISSTMENFLSQPRRLTKEKRAENHVVPTAAESTPLGPASADAPSRVSPMAHSAKSDFFPSENVRTPPLPGSSRLSRPSSFLTSNSELGDPAAGVDETDLMSHISRSLSMSMDYKQYQESVDRRMSMKNFSLKDIASEVAVLTKETSEGGLSVDSDTSTVQAVKPQSTSIYEAPTLPERNTESDNTWGTYSGIGYGSNDMRRSSGRYAPLNKETIDDLSNGNYSSLDNWPDLSPKSRSHLGSRDSTSHFVGDTYSEARDELMTVSDMAAEDDQSEVSAEGPSAEEMYNRLKMNSNPSALQPNNGYSSNGWPTANRVLKPSGSTMQLGLHKSSLSSNQASTSAKIDNKSLVGKSANERLYNAAQLDRDKRLRRAKIANDQEVKALDEGKFKLNSNSQKIVANLRPKGYQNVHIGERLHVEGVVEKQLKNKRSDELQGKLTPEEWSCAKCGTFQTIVKTSIVIQPLHQMQSKAHISNNTSDSVDGGKASKPAMICKECGWNQSAVQAHRPVNIALMMNEDPDELLRGRWQGNGPVAEEGGIHQYLYENARTRENIQQLNRVLWNEAHSGLTFAPSLPEASKEILGKYKTTTTAGAKTISSLGSSSGFSESDVGSPVHSAPVGLNKDGKNIIAGSAIGTYLSKSATERLSTTQTRPVLSNIPRHSENRNETESQMSTFKHADQSQFVNRLVYEYKDKRERQQKQAEFSSKHDINTGDRLFQPKVGPDPEEALGFGATTVRDKTNGPKRNVFEDIMLKDKLLKQKRKEAEDKAVALTMKELSEKQVKALDSSHQILQQSTQNNIEELFQVLLEAQQHIIQDSSASSDGSTEPEWKTYLVDLDMVNTEMMIAEVGLLLNEVRAYKLNQLQHAAPSGTVNNDGGDRAESNNMLVSFASFKDLVVKCMKRRDGTGRSYVYVPKKKADVTMQMIQNNLKEETFRPTIDKNSVTMSLRRHKDLSDYPIEDVLQVEGERIRSKWENARQERILQDSRELTFKPKLFKPPSYVKPKYWGMEETTPESDNDNEGEPQDNSPQRSAQLDLSAVANLSMESEDQSPPLDASSVVSSEAGQVLQMPALQPRPAATHVPFGAKTAIPLPSEAFAEAWSGGYEAQAEISPVRREHERSPGSKSSDDRSINTISTTFTTDEHGRHSSPLAAGGRSVSSGVPLVSRRYTSSLSKNSLPASASSAQNGSVVSSKSNSSITRKAIVVSKPSRASTSSGKAEAPPPLPLFPHELQQRTTPGNSTKSNGWKGGRVSDASELTASTELSRQATKQR